jgi:hypothetical protein
MSHEIDFKSHGTARAWNGRTLERSERARPFRDISDEDITTSGAYILAVRPPAGEPRRRCVVVPYGDGV